MDSGFLIKFLCFCAVKWFCGCLHRGASQQRAVATQTWFFLSTQHHVHVVKLKPKCAAVCFPLSWERPQKQIFNESREAGIFHLSVNLKQNQVSWHNSLSEVVMERRVLLSLWHLGVLQSSFPARAAQALGMSHVNWITEAIRVFAVQCGKKGEGSQGEGISSNRQE